MNEAAMLNEATEALRNLYSTTPENGALSLASIAQAVLDVANVAALRTRITELEAELLEISFKYQGSQFHPDWSVLEATRESLRETWARIAELEAANTTSAARASGGRAEGGGMKQLTVKQLKEQLERMPDDIPVTSILSLG